MSRRSNRRQYEGVRVTSTQRETRWPLVYGIPRFNTLIRRFWSDELTRRNLLTPRMVSRLPIIGLRSQRKLKGDRFVVSERPSFQDQLREFYQISRDPADRLTCARRSVRRSVLFARDIAGRRARSPGRGGTYRRTERSNYTCSRS